MSGEIKVNTEEYLSEAANLTSALEDFKRYSETVIDGLLTNLEGSNSDFNDSLKKVLKSINRSAGPELTADIEEHLEKIRALAEQFARTEEELTSAIAGGSRHD